MATDKNRTASGSPSAAARSKYGGGKGLEDDSFPVFDTKSGLDALQLRGHAPDPQDVINKVSAFANRTNNSELQDAVKKARAAEQAATAAKGRSMAASARGK